jgi:hypothetical protein
VTENTNVAGLDGLYYSLAKILDCIRETKETGAGQTKNTESENPGTFEDSSDVSTFLFH